MKVYRIKVEDMFYLKLVEESEGEILIDTVPLYKSQEAVLYNEKNAKIILDKLNNNKEFKDINMNFELEEAGGVDYSMEYGKKECIVCKKEFELKKEDRYIIKASINSFLPERLHEAFNCPYCGCQNVVNSYSQKYNNTKNNIKESN